MRQLRLYLSASSIRLLSLRVKRSPLYLCFLRNRRHRHLAPPILLAAALSLSWALATTFTALTLEELVQKADLALFGTVRNITVEAREGEPWTVVTLTVTRPLAGEFADSLSLAFYGGALETGLSVSVVGMPSFAVGEEVLLLAYNAPYYSPIVGFNQGQWRLTELGFVDVQERLLSLDEAGALLLDGEGGDTEAILTALAQLLESR